MSRAVKISITIITALAFVFLGLLLSVYFALKSPSITKKMVPQIQSALKQHAGIEATIGQFELDLIKHLTIHGFVGFYSKDKNRVDIKINKLQVSYSWWDLLNRSLKIDAIELDGVHIDAQLVAGPKEPVKHDQAKGPSKLDIDQILKPLEDLPASFHLRSLKLRNVEIAVKALDSKQMVKARVGPLNFDVDLELASKSASFAYELKTLPASVEMKGLNHGEQGIEAKLNLKISSLASGRLWKQEKWNVTLQSAKTDLFLKDIKFNQYSNKSQLQSRLSDFKFGWVLDVESDSGGGNPIFPLTYKLNGNLSIKAVDIHKKDEPNQLKLVASPSAKVSSQGRIKILPTEVEKIEHWLQSNTTLQLALKNLSLNLEAKGKQPKLVLLKRKSTKIEVDTSKQGVKVDLVSQIEGAKVPELKKVLDASLNLSLKDYLRLKPLTLDTRFKVDSHSLADFSLHLDDQAKSLIISSDLKSKLGPYLAQYHKQAVQLHKLGLLELNLRQNLKLKHGSESIRAVSFDDPMAFDLDLDSKISVRQLRRSKAALLALKNPLLASIKASKIGTQIKADLNLRSSKLKLPQLRKDLDFVFNSNHQLRMRSNWLKSSGQVLLVGKPLTRFSLIAMNLNRRASLDSKLTLFLSPKLQSYHPAAKQLELLGPVQLDVDASTNLKHRYNSVEKVKKFLPGMSVFSDVKTSLVRLSSQRGSKQRVEFIKPVKVATRATATLKKVKVDANIVAPELVIDKKHRINGLNTEVGFNSRAGFDPKDLGVKLQVKLAKFWSQDLPADLAQIEGLTEKLHLNAHLDLKNKQSFNLNSYNLSVGRNKIIQLGARGFGELKKQNAQTEGYLKVKMPALLSKKLNIRGAGSIVAPWDLTLVKGKRAAITAGLKFKDFSISGKDFKIKSMNGEVKVDETVTLIDYKSIKFAHLINRDPFRRVDYQNMSPFIKKKHTVFISELQFGGLKLGPVDASIGIEQNVFSVPSFSAQLFSGHMTGQTLLNFHPKHLKLNLNGRLTNLDPAQLVVSGKALRDKSNYKGRISANTAIELDLNKSLVEGMVNVTEIGGNQLIQLLNVIDPNYKDERLAPLRSALNFGYPESVSMTMNKGLMTLVVDLTLSGVSKQITIPNIPLSAIILSKLGPLKASIGKIPVTD